LLPYRELDDVLGLTAIAGKSLADTRTGKNGRHALVGLLRQFSVLIADVSNIWRMLCLLTFHAFRCPDKHPNVSDHLEHSGKIHATGSC
jgi:hypothetical protein